MRWVRASPRPSLRWGCSGPSPIFRWASDRKSTRLNSSHRCISYAVFCLKKKNLKHADTPHHLTYRTSLTQALSANTFTYSRVAGITLHTISDHDLMLVSLVVGSLPILVA